jgi:hypothetical protein
MSQALAHVCTAAVGELPSHPLTQAARSLPNWESAPNAPQAASCLHPSLQKAALFLPLLDELLLLAPQEIAAAKARQRSNATTVNIKAFLIIIFPAPG